MGCSIQLDKVCKGYVDPEGKHIQVLDQLSASIQAGEVWRLKGPSGSGKSTLLNLISGLLLPDRGEVRVDDQPIQTWSETKRDNFRANHVGYVFQTFNLLSPLRILENLVLPLRLTGRAKSDVTKQAQTALERLGLGDQSNKYPYQLSVGQRQRVAVARALLHEPKLLLADEPTASLDDLSAQQVRTALKELAKGGATLILATHDARLDELGECGVIDLTPSMKEVTK